MLNYYRNCDELPIFNFYKVLEEKDFNYLYPKFDGYNAVEKHSDIEETWKEIYEEYLDLSGDKTTLEYYELIGDIMYLTTRYKVVSALLTILATSTMEKEVTLLYVAELKNWDYVINTKNPFEKEMEKMVIQLRQSENRIRIKESKLEELKKENSSNENFTLVKQQVKLEQALSRNEINIKTVSVSKWIEMMNEVKEIKEQQRQQQQQRNNG
tara:strand:- start:243 stop:878 length:636 start_codon:yes stop_codon:yes gene_type:complete